MYLKIKNGSPKRPFYTVIKLRQRFRFVAITLSTVGQTLQTAALPGRIRGVTNSAVQADVFEPVVSDTRFNRHTRRDRFRQHQRIHGRPRLLVECVGGRHGNHARLHALRQSVFVAATASSTSEPVTNVK